MKEQVVRKQTMIFSLIHSVCLMQREIFFVRNQSAQRGWAGVGSFRDDYRMGTFSSDLFWSEKQRKSMDVNKLCDLFKDALHSKESINTNEVMSENYECEILLYISHRAVAYKGNVFFQSLWGLKTWLK